MRVCPLMRFRRDVGWAALGMLLAALFVARGFADDWPTYQRDNARSGMTSETLNLPLNEGWVFRSRHAPEPAWEPPRSVPVEGSLELPRVRFDDAYHLAVAGDAIFFGSSADNKVYCLDANTGRVRWTFFTGGPVRLAPSVWQEKVYFGSDDGQVYCLSATDGRVIWQRRVGPSDQRLIGHGKMISRWPVRTGVLVDDGVAYYGAGIFPAEGVYLEAVQADDGELLWRYDLGGEASEGRMSPQGYLLASASTLFSPQGRVSPAAFDRKTGRPVHFPYFGKYIGGTYALLAEDALYTGTEEVLAFQGLTRGKLAWFEGRRVIVTKDVAYMTSDKEMVAVSRETYPKASIQRFNARDLRTKLAGQRAILRRDKKALTGSLGANRGKLAEIEKQLAGLAAEDEKRAALDAEREKIEKAIQSDMEKVAAAEKKLEDIATELNEAEERWQQAGSDMAAGVLWRVACPCPDALIMAGPVLFAGGQDQVMAVDSTTGQKLWTGQVQGKAKGLAVGAGRLFVSTDAGAIYSFSPGVSPAHGTVGDPTNPSPYPRDALTPMYEAAAERIVRESGVKRGFALVLGGENGRLAYELAKRTELRLYAIESDGAKVDAARNALDAAGLYGTRVCVDQGDLTRLPYSSYFANLVVSDRALVAGLDGLSAQEMFRVLKPVGGVAMIGQPAAKQVTADGLRQWLKDGGAGGTVSEQGGVWAKVTRGPLPGAGRWTHQYANPGNTTCSDDTFVKCPLGLLWFGDPGPFHMVSRHRRAVAPLSVNGILFVEAEHVVMAFDAYNGLKLWERTIENVLRVGASIEASNVAADDTSFFVATGASCVRLDAATGEVKGTYRLPPAADDAPRKWGYIAVENGLLFGTSAKGSNVCETLFAFDLVTGKLRWTHAGGSIPHSSISIGGGRVFFADGVVTEAQRQAALRDALRGKSGKEAAHTLKTSPVYRLLALDANRGRPVWQKTVDLAGCVGGAHYPTLGSMYHEGVLVWFGVFTDGHYWKDFFAGQFEQRRITALAAKDGKPLWSRRIGYRVRPLIIGDTLHAEPWAFDLRTGEPRNRVNPVTGGAEPWQFARPGHHCGPPAASVHCMFFRSGSIGYYDLLGDQGVMHFGGQRPGCWINFIFANGLAMVPEASSGCMCPYPNMCTVVFAPREQNRGWGRYSLAGSPLPVKRLALNLGAPGDRKDPQGTLWLAYPRPGGSLVLPFKADVSLVPGGHYFQRSPDFVKVEGTASPWLYTFGTNGIKQVVVPLLAPEDGAARYTVRLGFAELENAKAGDRVFDILLQGKPALKRFDPVRAAGGPLKALVKEFRDVEVTDNLTIAFAPQASTPTATQWPVLQTIEVLREKVASLGLFVQPLQLSELVPEQKGEVWVGNLTDSDFAGALEIEPPAGFTVTPLRIGVQVASGGRAKLPLEAKVIQKLPRRAYPLTLKLVHKDGRVACEQQVDLDYLADRHRVVCKAVADADTVRANPSRVYGAGGTLMVDGGGAADDTHRVVYLKFKVDVTGEVTSAKLRLWNAGNPSSNGGNVCLVTEPWDEREITYAHRPTVGPVLGNIGRVEAHQMVEIPLKLDVVVGKEVSLAIDPVNADGVNYISREGGKPAELVVEFQKGIRRGANP